MRIGGDGHTDEGGRASDDGNDEVSGRRDGGRRVHAELAVLAPIAVRANALELALVLVVDALGAVPAARAPLAALVHVAARAAVLCLTFRATENTHTP